MNTLLNAALVILLACLTCSLAMGDEQTYVQQPGQAGQSDQAKLPKLKKVPESLLLTKRGRELASQWRRLNASVQTMGPKHPNRAALTEQLLKVEKELMAIEPALGRREPNPFRSRLRSMVDPEAEPTEKADSVTAPKSSATEGDEAQQLRRQLAELMMRVETLEKRVAELEAGEL